MESLQTGQNTQRVISNDKLIWDAPVNSMSSKKKVIVGVAIFFTIAALVGIGLGLYFHFRPNAVHLYTSVSSTNDGLTSFSSTKFVYTDKNLNGESFSQTLTVMFAGTNGPQIKQRMLQAADQQINIDATLHYTHESGIKIKFRNHQVSKIFVPIDQVMEYIIQQEDPEGYARFLQDLSQYDGQNETIQGSDIFDIFRNDLMSSVQQEHPNATIHQADIDFYEMDYDENSGTHKYAKASMTDARRRMLHFHFGKFHFGKILRDVGTLYGPLWPIIYSHPIGQFYKKATHDVVSFVKKDGPIILKYGAITALAAVDILTTQGPSGIQDAVKSFRSGNVLTALEISTKDVLSAAFPQAALPLDYISAACFSNPPEMHCTKQAAEKAVVSVAINYVANHAISTVLMLA